MNLRTECYYVTCSRPVARKTSAYCDGNCRQKHYQAYSKFGVKPDEFNEALKYQDYKCAICKRAEGDVRRLCVDHDHKTGLLRGLLCDDCNMGLGLFRDNMEYIYEALSYLGRAAMAHDINEYMCQEGVEGYSIYLHKPEKIWSDVVSEMMTKPDGSLV